MDPQQKLWTVGLEGAVLFTRDYAYGDNSPRRLIHIATVGNDNRNFPSATSPNSIPAWLPLASSNTIVFMNSLSPYSQLLNLRMIV